MDKKYESGTEVLIFNYMKDIMDQQELLKGIIVDSETSNNYTEEEEPIKITKYIVLGDDNNIYFGNYGYPTIGTNTFMTMEDYYGTTKKLQKVKY